MNRQDLAAAMAEKTNISKKAMNEAIGALMEVVEETLAKGEKISIVGLGTFEVRERAAREGRNPQTGEALHIPASKVPALKISKTLKDAVKNA